MNLKSEVPKFSQCQVAKAIHGYTRGRIRLAHEVRQGSEMRQAYGAASPNGPNAVVIPYSGEPLQVLYQIAGEFVQGVNQMKA